MPKFKNLSQKGLGIYKSYLLSASFLASLFGKAKVPFVHSRLHEFLFCLAFKAFNVSRKDLLVDAINKKTGFALKTFSSIAFQKIGEFGAHSNKIKKETSLKMNVRNVVKLFNERVEEAKKKLGLKDLFYNCLFRKDNCFLIYNENLQKLSLNKISNSCYKRNKTSFVFNQNGLEYSFYFAKNVLQRKFVPPKNGVIKIFCHKRIEPSSILASVAKCKTFLPEERDNLPFIILPLYSTRDLKNKEVSKGSSINAWNAKGRPRDLYEVYIPIPSILHKPFKSFLPDRYSRFSLHLPNGEIVEAKRKQAGGKAIGSTTEKYLGIWILGELRKRLPRIYQPFEKPFSYSFLKLTGFDAVRLTRFDQNNFFIRLERIGAYESFLRAHGLVALNI